MTQHTAAPWTFNNAGYGRHYVNAGNIVIADCAPFEGDSSYEKTESNAHLIAAAPDYYNACKDLPQIIEGESTTDYDKRVLSWFYNNAGKIHAANQKAKGE